MAQSQPDRLFDRVGSLVQRTLLSLNKFRLCLLIQFCDLRDLRAQQRRIEHEPAYALRQFGPMYHCVNPFESVGLGTLKGHQQGQHLNKECLRVHIQMIPYNLKQPEKEIEIVQQQLHSNFIHQLLRLLEDVASGQWLIFRRFISRA